MSQVLPVDVPRDLPGIRKYLPVFFGEAVRETNRVPRGPGGNIKPERAGTPFAYRKWFEHLAFLDGLPGVELNSDEALGLREFCSERERFWDQHKRCPQCRAIIPSHSRWCNCGWKEGKA